MGKGPVLGPYLYALSVWTSVWGKMGRIALLRICASRPEPPGFYFLFYYYFSEGPHSQRLLVFGGFRELDLILSDEESSALALLLIATDRAVQQPTLG